MPRRKDFLAGSAIMVVALIGFYNALDIKSFGNDPVGPGTLPKIVSVILVFLSFALIVKSFSTAAGPRVEAEKQDVIRVLAASGVLFLYVILFKVVGYLFSTIIISVILLRIFNNKMNIKIISSSILFSGLIYLIFVTLMGTYVAPSLLFQILRTHGN